MNVPAAALDEENAEVLGVLTSVEDDGRGGGLESSLSAATVPNVVVPKVGAAGYRVPAPSELIDGPVLLPMPVLVPLDTPKDDGDAIPNDIGAGLVELRVVAGVTIVAGVTGGGVERPSAPLVAAAGAHGREAGACCAAEVPVELCGSVCAASAAEAHVRLMHIAMDVLISSVLLSTSSCL